MHYYLYPLYHLQRDPFSTNIDRAALFVSAGHQLALQSVIAGIEERQGIVVLSGASGLGKTTLMRSIMENVESQDLKIIYLTDAALPFAELLEQLYDALDREDSPVFAPESIDELYPLLLEAYQQDGNLVLVIDNAHDLPPATWVDLERLADLEVDQVKLIQIVLLGQPALVEMLNHPALQQMQPHITVTAKLAPLTSDESIEYIQHRLGQVATDDAPIFSPEALQLLVKQAGGIPGTLNMLCTDVLNTGLARAERPIGVATLQAVLADFGLYSQNATWSWVLERVRGLRPRPSLPLHSGWRVLHGVWQVVGQRLRDERQRTRLHRLSTHIAQLAVSGWDGMWRGTRLLHLGAKTVTAHGCAVTQSLLPHVMQLIRNGFREFRLLRIDTHNTRMSARLQYQAAKAAEAALLQVNRPPHRFGPSWMLAGVTGVLLLVGVGWFSWYATRASRSFMDTDFFRPVLKRPSYQQAAPQDERATTPVAIAQESPPMVMVEPSPRAPLGSQPTAPDTPEQPAAASGASTREARVTVGREPQRVPRDIGSNVRGGGEQIRLLQKRLYAAGFTPGPIDGIFGPRTRQAIRRFQKAHGLQATGRLNATTRQALGF
jgi:general secretion pathway protein A